MNLYKNGNSTQFVSQDNQNTSHATAPMHVCLINCNEGAAKNLQAILGAFNYQVDVFHESDSALRELESGHFDVVLLAQLDQPKRAFISAIRASSVETLCRLPIIVFSQVCSDTLEKTMKDYGASCLLPSAAAPERIHDTICELLRNETSSGSSIPPQPDRSPQPVTGMLVTNADDAILQNEFLHANRTLDLYFSAGEALLAIARRPYQAFVIVEHNPTEESAGIQLAGIIRQLIDPTGTIIPIVAVSRAHDAQARFTAVGADTVLPLPLATSLVDCIDALVERASIDQYEENIRNVPPTPESSTTSQPNIASAPTASESQRPGATATTPSADETKANPAAEPQAKPAPRETKSDGPPPPPPPELKNRRAQELLKQNDNLFTALFPAAKDFKV